MLRGEVRLIELEPDDPDDPVPARPAVVVSTDIQNIRVAATGVGSITVVPVTTHVGAVYAFQVPLSRESVGLQSASKALVEQVRPVPLSRVGRKIGMLSNSEIMNVDRALRLHLGLND
jgi:mRNA interferase MazF